MSNDDLKELITETLKKLSDFSTSIDDKLITMSEDIDGIKTILRGLVEPNENTEDTYFCEECGEYHSNDEKEESEYIPAESFVQQYSGDILSAIIEISELIHPSEIMDYTYDDEAVDSFEIVPDNDSIMIKINADSVSYTIRAELILDIDEDSEKIKLEINGLIPFMKDEDEVEAIKTIRIVK